MTAGQWDNSTTFDRKSGYLNDKIAVGTLPLMFMASIKLNT